MFFPISGENLFKMLILQEDFPTVFTRETQARRKQRRWPLTSRLQPGRRHNNEKDIEMDSNYSRLAHHYCFLRLFVSQFPPSRSRRRKNSARRIGCRRVRLIILPIPLNVLSLNGKIHRQVYRMRGMSYRKRKPGAEIRDGVFSRRIKIHRQALRHFREPQPDARPDDRPHPPYRRPGETHTDKRRLRGRRACVQSLLHAVGRFSNWTEEDRYAVITYLRNIKPVKHKIPDFSPASDASCFTFYGLDYGIHEGDK